MGRVNQLKLLLGVILGFPTTLFAATLGSVAESLFEPTHFVTKLLIYACYIIGGTLCLTAVAQYQIHRRSPKLIPLTTPVLSLIIGLFLMLIPYFTSLFYSGSAIEYAKRKGVQEEGHTGLALPPLEHPRRRGPGDFLGGAAVPPRPRAPAPSAPVPPKKSGHWSDDSKYQ